MSEDFNYIQALQQQPPEPETQVPTQETAVAAPLPVSAPQVAPVPAPAPAVDAEKAEKVTGNDTAPPAGIAAAAITQTMRLLKPFVRLRGLLIVLAVVAVWGAGTGFHWPGKAPDLTDPSVIAQGTARNAIGEALTAQVRNDQQAARNYLATHGTLDGLKLSGKGVRAAAAGTIMVASRLTGGVCQAYFFTGQVDGQVFISMKDQKDAQGNPIPYLCDDNVMAAQQAELDAQAQAVQAAVQSGHQEAFAAASVNLVTHAMQTWSGGNPTVDGVPNDLGYGVKVVSTHGDHVIARHGEGPTCATAALATDGTVSEPNPCQ